MALLPAQLAEGATEGAPANESQSSMPPASARQSLVWLELHSLLLSSPDNPPDNLACAYALLLLLLLLLWGVV